MPQQQVQKTTPERKRKPVAEDVADAKSSAEQLKADLDAVLDDIESVLEENAETFVKDFVQKGGQ